VAALDHAVGELEALAAGAEPRPGLVRLELAGVVAELIIDNPDARGALTVPMMAELARAVRTLQGWDGAVVLIYGTDPRALCSGGHLDDVRSALLSAEAGHRMAVAMGQVLNALRDLPAVSVVVLRGAALGGGAELTTAADFRIWESTASLRFAQVALGVSTGWGGAGRLVTLVGRRQATRLLCFGPAVGADEALRLGLADQVVDGDGLAAARAFVAPILKRSIAAVRAAKRAVVAGEDLQAQADAFATVWAGPAHRRALGLTE